MYIEDIKQIVTTIMGGIEEREEENLIIASDLNARTGEGGGPIEGGSR